MGDTYMPPKHGWTCFHCGETFTHENVARNHFGALPDKMPGCLLRMQEGEHSMLRRIRYFESENEKLSAENTALRGDIARKDEALRPFAEAWKQLVEHKEAKSLFAVLSLEQLGRLASGMVSGVHFRRAASALTDGEE